MSFVCVYDLPIKDMSDSPNLLPIVRFGHRYFFWRINIFREGKKKNERWNNDLDRSEK